MPQWYAIFSVFVIIIHKCIIIFAFANVRFQIKHIYTRGEFNHLTAK